LRRGEQAFVSLTFESEKRTHKTRAHHVSVGTKKRKRERERVSLLLLFLFGERVVFNL